MPEMMKLGQSIGQTYWYDLDGTAFYQRTLVLGQSVRLIPLFEGMELQGANPQSVAQHVGDRMGEALDIILVPKGVTQQEHVRCLNVPGGESRAGSFLEGLTHVDLMGVVEDFFDCNLDSSLLDRLQRWFQGNLMQPAPLSHETRNGSVPSSPEATPETVMPSMGSH